MSLNFLRHFLNIVQQLHKSYVCTCACACFYPCACSCSCACACAPAVVGLGLVCGLVCHQVAPCAPAPPHTPLQARFCAGIMRRKMVITLIMIIWMIMIINVLLCKPSSAWALWGRGWRRWLKMITLFLKCHRLPSSAACMVRSTLHVHKFIHFLSNIIHWQCKFRHLLWKFTHVLCKILYKWWKNSRMWKTGAFHWLNPLSNSLRPSVAN